MNRRRPVKALTGDEVCALEHLWIHAHRQGCPLNTLITVKIDNFDRLSPQLKAEARSRILNNIGQCARRRRFALVYLWTREAKPGGTGEHFHVLAYIPPGLYENFRTQAKGWLPEGEIDIRPAHYRVWQDTKGKKRSILLYVAKQMTPQACYKRPWQRMRGGAVVGARWGCSRSLVTEKRSQLDVLAEKRRLRKLGLSPPERPAAARRGRSCSARPETTAPKEVSAAPAKEIDTASTLDEFLFEAEGAVLALKRPATGDRSWPDGVLPVGLRRLLRSDRLRGRPDGNCACRLAGRGGPRGPPGVPKG